MLKIHTYGTGEAKLVELPITGARLFYSYQLLIGVSHSTLLFLLDVSGQSKTTKKHMRQLNESVVGATHVQHDLSQKELDQHAWNALHEEIDQARWAGVF